MPVGHVLAGEPGGDQPRHPGDVAERPAGQLRSVERRQQVVEQPVGVQQPPPLPLVGVERLGAQQLDAVVVHRHRHHPRRFLGQPVGQQRPQPLVDQPALQRVEKQVVPVPGLNFFHQQFVGRGDHRPLPLQLQQRTHRRQLARLGFAVVTPAEAVEPLPDRGGQLRRQRRASALPGRDLGLAAAGLLARRDH